MAAGDGTGPGKPGKTVATNADNETDQAPPTVSGSPSSDTGGAMGTSTTEGPRQTPRDIHPPENDGGSARRVKTQRSAGVPAPGNRPDDAHENSGDKKMTRQE